jgi:hypothetical protein
VFGFLATTGLLLGQVIAVNRFSLHGMYRSRLARTFLGASRSKAERHPSPFTGFDAHDDLPMSALASNARPLHIVNATLNTVDDHRLANTERVAQSFTFSALHSGAASVGYRPSAQYAGGVTLGDAITTSGAAVNSNMGADAGGAQTFLLTVFNARLGVWLGNPGTRGASTWTKPIPNFGVGPLLNELLARTTDHNPYVNLSDGGHFDNLGVYEMVRRRCQTIVAIDAGADPAFAFGDLANVIRKVRVDFGVSITFPDGLPIGPSNAGDKRTRLGRRRHRLQDGRSHRNERPPALHQTDDSGRRADRRRELRACESAVSASADDEPVVRAGGVRELSRAGVAHGGVADGRRHVCRSTRTD